MTARIQRPRGALGRRLQALSLGLAVLFGLYLLALPSGARAATGEPTIPAEAAGAVDSPVSPGGQGPEALSGESQTAPAGDPAGIGDQQASTEQAATAGAETNQQEPRNIVVSVRINSPGDDGPITQENVAVAVSDGSNDSSTAQGSGVAGPGGQAGDQQAATGQTASSTATVTQDHAGNLVISIRINSPGNNGPISQTNTAIAISNAANTSATNQDVAAGAPDGPGGSSAVDPPVAIGPPGQQQEQSQAQGSTPAASQSRLIPLPTPVETSNARAAAHPARSAPAAPASAPTKAHRPGRESSRAVPTGAVAVADRPAVREKQWSPAAAAGPRVHHGTPARQAAAAHRDRLAPKRHGIRRRAADLLGSIAPGRALPVADRSNDVSSAVVLTLIAVLAAALIFAASAFLPSGRRLVDPRNWRVR
jgi:hypothetical protein